MKRVKLCAYDCGYGLVVSEYVGDSVHAIDRIHGDKFKIKRPADDLTDDKWLQEWSKQRNLVNEMVDAYNEKFGFTTNNLLNNDHEDDSN